MTQAIMIQGTGSNVGKSLLVAGLARACRRRGVSVAPFKPQNMSNNAAVTADGGEIGRAQALQALAAGLEPKTDMNPVLLKPESETGSQVIVQGQRLGHAEARRFWTQKPQLMSKVLESFHRLARQVDLVLIEGAGSPAETNLRRGDIANMGFATAANVPVLLVGDIDRGGVIAQIVGTQAVLDQNDLNQIVGFAVNRFRGDVRLFDEGVVDIEQRTGWPSLGVVPWFQDAWQLPAEDVLDIASRPGGSFKVAVPKLARIANFDDLDPLAAEPDVTVDIIEPGRALPGDADLVLLPGSKATIDDLLFLRAQGWDVDIAAHVRRGGLLFGLCGGFQILGKTISDPDGIEGPPRQVDGLGYLDVHTTLAPHKELANRRAQCVHSKADVTGYEIHMGRTEGADMSRPWFAIDGQPEGAQTDNGQVRGTYLHGIFGSDSFRATILKETGHSPQIQYDALVDKTLDALASHLEAHLDIDQLLKLTRTVE